MDALIPALWCIRATEAVYAECGTQENANNRLFAAKQAARIEAEPAAKTVPQPQVRRQSDQSIRDYMRMVVSEYLTVAARFSL